MRNKRVPTEQWSQAKALMASVVGQLHLVEVDRTLVASAAELADTETLRRYVAVHLAASRRRGLHVANPLES